MRMAEDPEFLPQKLKMDHLRPSSPLRELPFSCLIALIPMSEGPYLGRSLSICTVG